MNNFADITTELNDFISRHAKFKNSYFWTPPCKSAERRRMEDENELSIDFEFEGETYSFSQYVRCSCKNVYYISSCSQNGEHKDIRLAKKVLKELGKKLLLDLG